MDHKRIAIAFLIVLTNSIGATVILPMMPLYVEKQFGATLLQSTLVIAAFYAAQILAAPWLGKLSDRLGRRPILIVSQVGTIVAYLLIVFANEFGMGLERIGVAMGISGGLVVIFLARIIDGVTGGNVSVAEAYASDISDERSRTQALGLIGGASGVGHILGPAIAALLSGISLIAPVIGAVVMGGLTLLLTIILLDETITPEKKFARNTIAVQPARGTSLSHVPVFIVLSAAFAIGLYLASVMGSFALYAERALFPNEPAEVVARNSGLLVMLMGLGTAISQVFLIGPLVRRVGDKAMVVAGAILLLGSAIGFGLATSAIAVILPVIAYGLGFAFSWPSLQSIITRLGSAADAGKLLGFFQSSFSLALILGPVGAGLALESGGPHALFNDAAWLLGLAILLAVVVGHLTLSQVDESSIGGDKSAPKRGFLNHLHH